MSTFEQGGRPCRSRSRLRAGAARAGGVERLHPPHDRDPNDGGEARGSGGGRHLRRARPRRPPGRRACAAAGRLMDDRELLRARWEARPVPGRAGAATSRASTGGGRSSPPRSTWRCARPGSSLAQALGSRGATGRRSWCRCGSGRRRRSSRCESASTAIHAAVQARPDQRLDRRADRRAGRDRRVDSVDFKGFYKGTVVDQPPDPDLYRRVAEAFPEAWIEDPGLNDETTPGARAAQGPLHLGRADPLDRRHRGASLPAADGEREAVAVREPEGALRRLRLARRARHRRVRRRPVRARLGRGQIQYLASLFHPDTPNDVAPSEFNLADPPPGSPRARSSLA